MTEPEDTDIQKLIRLKRYEQPPEGFVDDFLIRFHHRQRAEILKQSSISLFWERLVTFMEGRVSPGMGLAGAAAAVLILGGAVFVMPHGGPVTSVAAAPTKSSDSQGQAVLTSAPGEAFVASPFFGVDPQDQELPSLPTPKLAELLSQHFRGGFADEHAYKVSTLLNDDGLNHLSAAPLLNTQQNGSAANIQKQ